MNNAWTFNNEIFDTAPEDHYGFVYEIENLETGQKYIGKKIFWNTVTRPPLKGKKRKRKIRKESKWKDYFGSSEFLLEDVNKLGKEKFARRILTLCKTKSHCTYEEVRQQFVQDVLYARLKNGEKAFYNGNISGKFHWREEIEESLNQ